VLPVAGNNTVFTVNAAFNPSQSDNP